MSAWPLIREQVKAVAVKSVSRLKQPVVVNSFGRSGSTMLFDSIVDSAGRRRLPSRFSRRLIEATAWDLDTSDLRSGRCYKSHDYPPNILPSNTRMIYVFGDPVAATMSAYRYAGESPAWLERHCEHLRAPICGREELLERDVLHIEAHLEAWLTQTNGTVAFARFETLWDYQSQLSEFVGLDVRLPQRRPRRETKVPDPRLAEMLGRMNRKILELPNWWIQ